MPANTPKRGYPVPLGQDSFLAAAAQIAALGNAIDADVDALAPIVRQVQRTGAGPTIPDGSGGTASTIITGFNSTTVSVGSPVPAYAAGAFTVGVAGVWEAVLTVGWSTIAAAHRTVLHITHNGDNTPDGIDTKWYPAGTGGQTFQSVSAWVVCAAGDTIGNSVYQDSGSSQTLVADGSLFGVRRIG